MIDDVTHERLFRMEALLAQVVDLLVEIRDQLQVVEYDEDHEHEMDPETGRCSCGMQLFLGG